MELSTLTAISPVDGRYAHQVRELRAVFSEYGLIRARVRVEVRWLQALSRSEGITELPTFSAEAQRRLDDIVDGFDRDAAERVKDIERVTNHDVKAVEYYLRTQSKVLPELEQHSSFWHFACTSEDINNLAYALMVSEARTRCLLPATDALMDTLSHMAHDHGASAMISRTHGQLATPTTVGKEIAVFLNRLKRQRALLAQAPIMGKMNGAVGNYNAHVAAYPRVDWPELSRDFVQSLGLEWNPYTTQIEPHDYLAEICHTLIRFNSIVLDLARDIWSYISLGYFRQRVVKGEVGSSTMPHKVNPIDFENAEGNIGVANSMLKHLAEKLPVSRLQRDLSDSTTLRNLGVALAHCVVAYAACLKGLGKLEVDHDALTRDLDGAWEVLAEALQTIMRRYGVDDAYERLKTRTRGRRLTEVEFLEFVESLHEIPDSEKERLKQMRPHTYTGEAENLASSV